MTYTVLEEGFTIVELENGDKLKLKIVVGDVQAMKGQKDPQGNQVYSLNHQVVTFLVPKVRS